MIKFQGSYIIYAARSLFVQKVELCKEIAESLLTATAQRWHLGDSQEPCVSQIDITYLDPEVALP